MRTSYFFGLVLIILGAGLLLNQFGIWDFSIILETWWPVLVVLLGIVFLTKNQHSIFAGAVVIAIGLILQASELGFIHGGFWHVFWPFLLIMIGISFLTTRYRSQNKNKKVDHDIDYFTFFSGRDQNIVSDHFKGGSITTFFGGSDIDLRQSNIAPEGAILDVTVCFGGLELVVPETWKVITSGVPIFGAMENRLNLPGDPFAPVLKVNYLVMFGGIEIRYKRKHEHF